MCLPASPFPTFGLKQRSFAHFCDTFWVARENLVQHQHQLEGLLELVGVERPRRRRPRCPRWPGRTPGGVVIVIVIVVVVAVVAAHLS